MLDLAESCFALLLVGMHPALIPDQEKLIHHNRAFLAQIGFEIIRRMMMIFSK
jgi:hypothetical protein